MPIWRGASVGAAPNDKAHAGLAAIAATHTTHTKADNVASAA
ncbi:hypothetical protein [Bombella sp. ESL0385]|nr:hypothetical protein [Bombella sp. ESL0385]